LDPTEATTALDRSIVAAGFTGPPAAAEVGVAFMAAVVEVPSAAAAAMVVAVVVEAAEAAITN
jgi:hypothetical protein